MKITITESTTTIEADVRELSASNSLAQSIERAMAGIFQRLGPTIDVEDDEEDEADEQ